MFVSIRLTASFLAESDCFAILSLGFEVVLGALLFVLLAAAFCFMSRNKTFFQLFGCKLSRRGRAWRFKVRSISSMSLLERARIELWKSMTSIRFAPAREKRARISRGLFYAGYGLWIIWKFISITVLSFPEGSVVHTILHALVLLLLLISILANPPKMSVCVLSGISLAVSLLVMKQSGQLYLTRPHDDSRFRVPVANMDNSSIYLDSCWLLECDNSCRIATGLIVDYPFSRENDKAVLGLGTLRI